MGEIQISKISTSILKLVFFFNDNFLWSSSIKLKFWANVEYIYLICLPKSQGVCNCWEGVVGHFVFDPDLKWFQGNNKIFHFMKSNELNFLKDDNKHSFSCCTIISNQSKFICEQCNFAKLLVTQVYIGKTSKQFLKWIKYNLGKLEGRSLDFENYGT